MPYFRTTRRFAPGGRLGHDRIALAAESLGAFAARIGPCEHIIYIESRYVHIMSALRVRTCPAPWGMSAQEHTLTFCRFF